MTMGELREVAAKLIGALWIQRAVDPDLMHDKSPAIINVKYVDIAETHITAAVSQERERIVQAVKDMDAAEADAMGASCIDFEDKLITTIRG